MLERSKTALCAGAFLLISGASARAESGDNNFARVEKGRYLTTAGDCTACHTSAGGAPFAGGRPLETPFGTLLAPNITPDRETGIGAWTDREFLAAMKQGIGKGGYHIYPAMPYVYYSAMSDDDVVAIRAYLSTVPAVRNPVVANQLPFPLNIRANLRFWNALYFRGEEFRADPAKSEAWNRGAYLVRGPMHCGACHTPKSSLGGDKTSHEFEGGLLQGWYAPNITNEERRGLGTWSVDDIAQYLKTGHNKFAGASGPMAEEVELSSSHMAIEDLKAVAVYLKDQPGTPASKETAIAQDTPVMRAGGAIYNDVCSSCHAKDGRGVPGLFPALKGAPAVQSDDPTTLIRAVVNGAKTVSTDGAPTGPGMPSYAWQLNDEQIAAVLTYVRNTWGNAAPSVSESDVKAARSALLARKE